MNNIAVLGGTGFIGKEVMKYPNTVHCPLRFEDPQVDYDAWFLENPQIDTVIHLARACKRKGERSKSRDLDTFLSEMAGIQKLLTVLDSSTRIVFASTCCVYGIFGPDYTRYTAAQVAAQIMEPGIGIENCPKDETESQLVDLTDLADHQKIYVMTKLAIEQMIQHHTKNHKILRIWSTQK